MILVYLGLLLVLMYTAIMVSKCGYIPPSISETFYLGGGYWFTITLFAASFLITAGLLELTEGETFQFVSFLTGAGMGFVGAAPHFHDSEKTIHYIGAFVLLIGSQLWLSLFVSPWCLLLWLTSIFWIFGDKKMFWCEMTAIFSVGFGLLFLSN